MAKSIVNKILYQCFTGAIGQDAAENIARDAKLDLTRPIETATDLANLNYARKLLRSAGFRIVLERLGPDEIDDQGQGGNVIDNILKG